MIEELITLAKRPPLFLESTAPFWDDDHISGQMLKTHLDPTEEKASRKPETIDASVSWIKGTSIKEDPSSILDLGCGPGLYCRRLAGKTTRVTGIDISRRSIAYARREAEKAHLLIDYHNKDYLTIDFTQEFDIVLLIFCDFAVLSPSKQQILLSKIYQALKPGGVFLFDVYTPCFPKYREEKNSWYTALTGFWKENPHICLHNQYHYPQNRAFVDQYIIIENNENIDVYRIWDQYYTETSIMELLGKQPFKKIELFGDITGREYTAESETLCAVCRK
ncbi:MAG: methyltransferase domain-containing protein [Spirochaetales bacterium]|nr:methyltransferase domain-containing protein [Spirochaetales bacterium]